ncbi:MAG: TIGR02147 family protein, partial [Fibrobacter sp.]|nr:TIGR02147 family protein [Fibrobacter sp.]
MDSLFESLDYRHYLKSRFDKMREKKSFVSYRLIAQKLKMDPGQLVKILQGHRHISERLIPVFSNYLGLKGREEEFFQCLVRFNKAKTTTETSLYFDKLMEIKDLVLPRVEPDQDRFYQK